MLPFAGGEATDLLTLKARLAAAKDEHGIEGLTLLGGEPFAHASAGAELAAYAHELKLSVMIFSGFTLEELQAREETEIHALLSHTDLLVDGPYLREQPDHARRWIGSTNQRIHFLSDRYQADDPAWQAPNTLEIRWTDGVLAVNGFPAAQAKRIWKRPTV
jgi:anaerobic ribonucleoside-triphosphate reductase activating protein